MVQRWEKFDAALLNPRNPRNPWLENKRIDDSSKSRLHLRHEI
jgi:hypothetical protein